MIDDDQRHLAVRKIAPIAMREQHISKIQCDTGDIASIPVILRSRADDVAIGTARGRGVKATSQSSARSSSLAIC